MASDKIRTVRTTQLADDNTLDPEEQRRITESLKGREQSPSSRSASLAYQYFQQQMGELGEPYNVDRIPISVLKQMQRDPMVGFGLHFIYAPIYRSKWYIKCEDPRIAAFVDGALRRILARYISTRAQAMVFGFKPIIKRFQTEIPNWTYKDPSKSEVPIRVWNNGNIEAITWKPFYGLPCDPVQVEPRFKESDGSFNGIKWQGGFNNSFNVPANPNDTGTRNVDLQHALWITNEKASANESLYGYPRIGYAFRPWWSKWYRWALYDRFFERKADPPYQVYFPTEIPYGKDEDEVITANKSMALEMGDRARSGGTLAFPGNVVKGYDERPTTIREWEISELEVKGDMAGFLDSFEYLDTLILRSLWISELMLTPGVGGTSSKNVAGTEVDFHKEASAALAEEIDEELNRWVIPDLVTANFPAFDGEVSKVTTGFTEADQSAMQQALQWTIQAGQNDAIEQLDTRGLLERLGMPLVSEKEIARQREEAAKALEQETPPVINPDNQGNAAVDGAGFYIAGRPSLTLSDTEDFIASLPDIRAFKDKVILSKTKAIRTMWKSAYKDIYSDFAKHVMSINFNTENFDEADDLAERIIESWAFEQNPTQELVDNTRNILSDAIRRAGETELSSVDVDPNWNPDITDVAQYLEDRGALLVEAINDTVREELRSFLAEEIRKGSTQEQIVSGIQTHFADFPEWKADRLARTEIKEAYNHATLVAGDQSGFNTVQARDALKGPTDEECEERDGKFFGIAEALNIKDHPNGTLQWQLVQGQNLSIDYVENMPDGSDSLAYFDADNEVVYLSNTIPESVEKDYLYTLGDSLV